MSSRLECLLPATPVRLGVAEVPGRGPQATHVTCDARWIDAPVGPLFAWLHRGPPAMGGTGVGAVLCAPLGQEMMGAYRTSQALADALAARGLPAVRFDYPGCGDSADVTAHRAGLSTDLGCDTWASADAVAHWQVGIEAAIEHLKRHAGVDRVVLLGVRAGALLALPVAVRRDDVAALALLMPVTRGRTLLREWKAWAATSALRTEHRDGTVEAGGGRYGPATVQTLQGLDAQALDWPTPKPLLVFESAAQPATARWLEALREQGAQPVHELHAELDSMLLEPHLQRVPQAAVAAVGDAVLRSLGLAGALRSGAALPAPPASSASGGGGPSSVQEALTGQSRPGWPDILSEGADVDARTARWVLPGIHERAVRIGGRLSGFGIVSEPRVLAAAAMTIVLPNTGAAHHTGVHRLYVDLARRLAGLGHRVLRVDLGGLGDSPTRPGEAPDVVYSPYAVDDLARVVADAAARWPGQPVSALGLCSGAFHVLRLAVRQPGLQRAFVVNPLVYHWHEGLTLDGDAARVQAAYYQGKWRQWRSWQRLLSGRSEWPAVRLAVRHHLKRLLPPCSRGPRPAADDLAADLLRATSHGSRLHFVFSPGEPGWPALQAQGGMAVTALAQGGSLTVDHLAIGDHSLSIAAAREALIANVTARLQREGAAAETTP